VTFAVWQENPPYLHLFQTHLCDGLDPTRRQTTSEFDPRIFSAASRSRLRQDAAAGRGPSRLRINKPRPYRVNFYGKRGMDCELGEESVGMKKKERGGPGRPASRFSPFGECPASLTEGGQPVVCWPGYETPETRKKLRSDQKKLSRIRGAAQPPVHPRSAYATPLTLESR
jgi:hypothetical protein